MPSRGAARGAVVTRGVRTTGEGTARLSSPLVGRRVLTLGGARLAVGVAAAALLAAAGASRVRLAVGVGLGALRGGIKASGEEGRGEWARRESRLGLASWWRWRRAAGLVRGVVAGCSDCWLTGEGSWQMT